MKSLRLSFMLVSILSLGLLFASAGLVAQNPFQPGPKYSTPSKILLYACNPRVAVAGFMGVIATS